MRSTAFLITGLVAAVEAQEIYITTTGTSARPQCTQPTDSPSYYFQQFSFTQKDTVR